MEVELEVELEPFTGLEFACLLGPGSQKMWLFSEGLVKGAEDKFAEELKINQDFVKMKYQKVNM